MLRLELSDSDWQTSKRYWNELKKQFIKPDDVKKANFVTHALFETTTTPHTIIPSINSMNEIMSEIDSELKTDEKNDCDIDVKTQKQIIATTTVANTNGNDIDQALKQFIGLPVE